jgi:glycosyltransferase involved in cell wall biosynthesis
MFIGTPPERLRPSMIPGVLSKGMRAPRVLISTAAPGLGGVDAMTQFVVNSLAARGLEPVIAHYAPYSAHPKLSVPAFRLLQRRTAMKRALAYDSRETHLVGAWLPELEFTHYAPTAHWKKLMDSCDAFVAVSGNVLAATPFLGTGRPYLAWVATDWQGDREDRAKRFPLGRRLLDFVVNGPVIRRLEKRLLVSGHILSLSNFTAQALATIAGPSFPKVILPVAIDAELFAPKPAALMPGRLGFAGRFNDPRKNIGLFLRAVAQLRGRGHDVSAVLMGDTANAHVKELIAGLGLASHVSIKGGLTRAEMRDCMQALDVFVLPSHQEGLCISALEAMACGVPVVSTCCGGPEEFVVPGATGALVTSDAEEMADAIAPIIGDRELRSRMSRSARQMVEDRYSSARLDAIFVQAFKTTFPALRGQRPKPEVKQFPIAANESVV